MRFQFTVIFRHSPGLFISIELGLRSRSLFHLRFIFRLMEDKSIQFGALLFGRVFAPRRVGTRIIPANVVALFLLAIGAEQQRAKKPTERTRGDRKRRRRRRRRGRIDIWFRFISLNHADNSFRLPHDIQSHPFNSKYH